MEPIQYESAEPTELLETEDDDDVILDEAKSLIPINTNGNYAVFDFKNDSTRKRLPIENFRTQVVKTINKRRVTIIEGSTGCGKTTQVPIYIAEDAKMRGDKINIIVTQPRRIAAASVAKHVAQLLHCQLGKFVGYQVSLDKKHSGHQTGILYCTTGVLLQKIIHSKSLSYFTHIIIDEVHERDVEVDLLLMVVRKLMFEQNPDVKLVLMSATSESANLQTYFSINFEDPKFLHLTKPEILKIDGTPAALEVFYLNTLRANNIREFPPMSAFSKNDPRIVDGLYSVCAIILDILEIQENELKDAKKETKERGAVLIFLPGLHEINEMRDRIQSKTEASKKFLVMTLHSCINDDEQYKIFERAKPGIRKVILATNIAESSITVPDICYVIDFCLTKQLLVDQESGLQTLKIQWATQANCTQRAGRAGRVTDGRVFRLVYENFYANLEKHPTPEICRCPLDLAVLRTKILALGSPKELLAQCLKPPLIEGIRSSVLKLKRIGALTVLNANDIFEYEDGELTAIGKIMSNMPIEVTLSKLICLGYAFGLLEECVNIAACLSVKNIFFAEPHERLNVYRSKWRWSDGSFCDLITLLNLFTKFLSFFENGGRGPDTFWLKRNSVNLRRLEEARVIREELITRLNAIGMCIDDLASYQDNTLDPLCKILTLKCIFAGAFYPNYFKRSDVDEESIEKHSINPYNSVYVTKIPVDGILYAKQIQNLFSEAATNIDLRFWASNQVDVIFPQDEIAKRKIETEFSQSVYIALMMKTLNYPFQLQVVQQIQCYESNLNALNEAKKKIIEASNSNGLSFYLSSCKSKIIPAHEPPNHNLARIKVQVTHVVECGHFWARINPHDIDFCNRIDQAFARLSQLQLVQIDKNSIYKKMPVIYMTNEGNVEKLKRAIVQSIDSSSKVFTCLIRLIDSGECLSVHCNSLYKMDFDCIENDPELSCLAEPAAAIECQLIRIKPFARQGNCWTKEANSYFEDLIKNETLDLDVYSYANEVLRVKFFFLKPDASGETIDDDISTHLVKKRYAQFSKESVASEHNHRIRLQTRGYSANTVDYEKPLQGISDALFIKREQGKVCHKLNGPHNPFEVFFSGLPKCYNYPLRIDSSSINAVVLEPDTSLELSRMMISPTCGVSNLKIIAYQTSLMPQIRGFPALMQLLFAPVIELRSNEKMGFYSGAISGIGSFPQPQEKGPDRYFSYDDDFDIELEYDAYLTNTDLKRIQKIRYILSFIFNDSSTSHAKVNLLLKGSALNQQQEDLRRTLLLLLYNDRFPLPRTEETFNRWCATDPSKFDPPVATEIKNPFLPLFRKISNINPDLKELKNKLETLKDDKTRQGTCPVCGDTFFSRLKIRQHLDSEEHAFRLLQFEIHSAQDEETEQDLELDDDIDDYDGSDFAVQDVEQMEL